MLTSSVRTLTFAWVLAALAASASHAQTPKEDDYYKITTFTIPEELMIEAGGLEMLPTGQLAVSTRRGDIYLVSNPFAVNANEPKFSQFAGGLHEVLGLAWKDGWLYATQRGELSRMKDEDGDGRADVFETVNDGWEITGDYHEYAFGSKFDPEGGIWITLCLTGSFTSNCIYRGWCLRVNDKGQLEPICSGLRSPGGVGFNAAGDVFYTDNQGPWNGACSLKHLHRGSFQGHPDGNRWYGESGLGAAPETPKSGSRMMVEAKRIPELEPPAVYFPYPKMGQSAAGIACDTTGGKFGPFQEQLFVADQSHSTLMRVFLEKVKGHYQGACFPFRSGFRSGSLSLLMTERGSMFVGGTNRGWGSRGQGSQAVERLDWLGKTPFEVQEMRARPDGFELTFTEPVDSKTAADPASYTIETYTYIYQASYGSPEVDQTKPTIDRIEVTEDGRRARLFLSKLEEGHVHELHLPGVRSAVGAPLLHPSAYYTLNYIPDGA